MLSARNRVDPECTHLQGHSSDSAFFTHSLLSFQDGIDLNVLIYLELKQNAALPYIVPQEGAGPRGLDSVHIVCLIGGWLSSSAMTAKRPFSKSAKPGPYCLKVHLSLETKGPHYRMRQLVK